MKRLLGALAASAFGLLIALGGGELAARIIMPHWSEYASERFMRPTSSPQFGGFTIGAAGFDGWFAQNNGDFRIPIHIDTHGLRNPDDAHAEGALWAVGDSFTFGWGVEREQSFGAVAADRLGLPFYSVASPGTNICGYMGLLARQPASLRPKAVVLGLTIENDIDEYDGCRPTPSVTPAAPPAETAFSQRRAATKEWLLSHSSFYNLLASTLKRSPVVLELLQKAGAVEREMAVGWHQARHDASTLEKTAAALAQLHALLPAGTPFAVIVIPARFDLTDQSAEWTADREALVAAIRRHGLTVVDPVAELRQAGEKNAHFAHDGHWSPQGHRIAGEAAAETLRSMIKDVP